MGCFLKALPNVKSAYVTCKEFTPNLQIFYTFLIFGFDVQVSGLKLPQWNTFIEFGLNVQVSGVILPHWNGPFSQSFTQRQKRVCYYQKIYPRPPKNLHRLICHICDISQLWYPPHFLSWLRDVQTNYEQKTIYQGVYKADWRRFISISNIFKQVWFGFF